MPSPTDRRTRIPDLVENASTMVTVSGGLVDCRQAMESRRRSLMLWRTMPGMQRRFRR